MIDVEHFAVVHVEPEADDLPFGLPERIEAVGVPAAVTHDLKPRRLFLFESTVPTLVGVAPEELGGAATVGAEAELDLLPGRRFQAQERGELRIGSLPAARKWSVPPLTFTSVS